MIDAAQAKKKAARTKVCPVARAKLSNWRHIDLAPESQTLLRF
ncbi:hypothetical protein [Sphingobium sp. Ndbn-10]|nr:hypothetical protein [Sphingobium sp. Ndbn-10]